MRFQTGHRSSADLLAIGFHSHSEVHLSPIGCGKKKPRRHTGVKGDTELSWIDQLPGSGALRSGKDDAHLGTHRVMRQYGRQDAAPHAQTREGHWVG